MCGSIHSNGCLKYKYCTEREQYMICSTKIKWISLPCNFLPCFFYFFYFLFFFLQSGRAGLCPSLQPWEQPWKTPVRQILPTLVRVRALYHSPVRWDVVLAIRTTPTYSKNKLVLKNILLKIIKFWWGRSHHPHSETCWTWRKQAFKTVLLSSSCQIR